MKWSESRSVVSDSLRPHGGYSPWNSPGQNTGVGSHSLLQGTFPTRGSNPGLLHCRQILYQLSYQGSPGICTVVNFAFFGFSEYPWWFRHFVFKICECLNWLAFSALHSTMNSVNVWLSSSNALWGWWIIQCCVYYQEFLDFLIPFCPFLIIMAVETVLVHAEGRMDDHDNDMSLYL